MENSIEVTQKMKTKFTIRSKKFTSWYTSNENEISISKKHQHDHAHCNITQNTQEVKQFKGPLAHEWLMKMSKEGENLVIVTAQMSLGNNMLNAIS